MGETEASDRVKFLSLLQCLLTRKYGALVEKGRARPALSALSDCQRDLVLLF